VRQVGTRQGAALHALDAGRIQMRQIGAARWPAARDDARCYGFDYWMQRHMNFLKNEYFVKFYYKMPAQKHSCGGRRQK